MIRWVQTDQRGWIQPDDGRGRMQLLQQILIVHNLQCNEIKLQVGQTPGTPLLMRGFRVCKLSYGVIEDKLIRLEEHAYRLSRGYKI
jgi:hypothetical protein